MLGVEDDFHWTSDGFNGTSASRDNVTGNGAFTAATYGPLYFILENAVIPEPASLSLLGVGGLMLLRWRRRCAASLPR